MNGGMTAVCAADSIRRDTPLSFPFEKSGAIGPSFDAVWFGDPVLHLPAGTWRIKAYTTISTDDGPPPSDGSFACGTRDHGQEASTVITVSGDPDILPSAPPSANPTAEVSPSPSAAAPDRPIVSPSPGPVSGSVTDGSFRLDLTTPTGIYAENEMIMPVATLTYVGPDPTVTIEYGEPYVTFAVEEIGGVGRLAGSGSEVGSTATLARGVPTKIPFALALDQAWLADPVLKLPPGLWRITATFSAVIPGLGAFPIGSHRVSVENVIAVVGASKDGPAPSPSGPPDLQVAGALVAKFEDALSSGHADSVWTWLSPWSQHAAGSLAQFEQQYTRPAGAPAVEIGQPTQDPAMLTEAFLGARAADIAARADPAGTFVVSVRDPGIDGAAAATTNLVVARTVDGTWLIWLDVPVG